MQIINVAESKACLTTDHAQLRSTVDVDKGVDYIRCELENLKNKTPARRYGLVYVKVRSTMYANTEIPALIILRNGTEWNLSSHYATERNGTLLTWPIFTSRI